MINNSKQLQNTMVSFGSNTINRIGSKRDIKSIVFFALIFIYFYIGKWKIFTIFGISTDYAFWLFIIGWLTIVLLFEQKIRISKNIAPIILYALYQFVEMQRSVYPTTAGISFLFNVVTLWVFLFVVNRRGYERMFIKCLYCGGIYYTVMVLIQAITPFSINHIREVLLARADVEAGLRGYENTTQYISGLAPNSAIAAFFIAMMTGICFSRILVNEKIVKNILYFFAGIVSLILTQKRSLPLCVALAIAIVLLFFKKGLKKRFKMFITFFLVGSIAFYIMYTVMPAMSIFMSRLLNLNNTDFYSGRLDLYEVMMKWFYSNPFLGVGIGTANHSFGYGGHNCYIQLLGEEGFIGCVIYGIVIIPYIVLLFKKLVKSWNSKIVDENTSILLSCSICVVIILIYAFSGNPLYDYTFCLTFFMLLAIPSQI